jgi:hypothetical protein
MRLGILNQKFVVQGRAAPLETSMHQACGAEGVRIAESGNVSRNRTGAAQELSVQNLGSGRSNPFQGRITGEIFKGQDRDPLDGPSRTGAGYGDPRKDNGCERKRKFQRTLYSALRIS